jgi:hypothetical protein
MFVFFQEVRVGLEEVILRGDLEKLAECVLILILLLWLEDCVSIE